MSRRPFYRTAEYARVAYWKRCRRAGHTPVVMPPEHRVMLSPDLNWDYCRCYTEMGQTYTSATDICEMLGIGNPTRSIKTHCLPSGVHTRNALPPHNTPEYVALARKGGVGPRMIFLTHGNVLRLIVRTRTPEAAIYEGYLNDEQWARGWAEPIGTTISRSVPLASLRQSQKERREAAKKQPKMAWG